MSPLGIHGLPGYPHPSGNGGSRVLKCFLKENTMAHWIFACYVNIRKQRVSFSVGKAQSGKPQSGFLLRHGSRGANTVVDGSVEKAKGVSI